MYPEPTSNQSREPHSKRSSKEDSFMAMASKEHNYSFSVLMLPWLAHGHISPYLELAKKLTQRNFKVYFCSTPINLSSIKQNDQISSTTSSSIQLVELHLPSLPNLPPHYHTTKSLPPHLMSTLKTAFDMASPSFSNLLTTLKPNLVIYDFIPPWAPSTASRHNIPAVQFSSTAAAFGSFFYHMFMNIDEFPFPFPFPSIYLTDHEQLKVSQMTQYSSKGLDDKDGVFQCTELSTDIVLIKTFREIEAKYIDYLSHMVRKEVIPVGPLVHEEPINDIEYYNDKFIEWLESKEKSSVVFVSFGTEFFMSKEEIEEMAYGLELSKVNFIWVIRFHEGEEKMSLHEALPQGFMERIGDKGMVVEGWAPQGKILRHPSIGGFVSHCGWSSVLESMKYGVPIVAVPMQLDQPVNARLVVELGLGIEVKKSGDGKLEREEVAKVIREVVMEKEGEEVKRKAKEMSVKIKDKGEEEIDVVVEKLVQLCERKTTH